MLLTVTLNPTIDRIQTLSELVPGGTLSAQTGLATPGGKGLNVSRVLNTLGIRSRAVAIVGTDQLENFKAEIGVWAEPFLMANKGPTRLNTTIQEANGRETHIRESGVPADETAITALFALLDKLQVAEGDTIAICGSAPLKFPFERFGEALNFMAAQGARIVLDVPMPFLKLAAIANITLLKINEEEFRMLCIKLGEKRALPRVTGSEPLSMLLNAIKTLRNIKRVVVTRGAKGVATLINGQPQNFRLTPGVDANEIKTEVGSGDAFLAGLLAAEVAEKSEAEQIHSGLAAAAANLMSLPAGSITNDDYQGFLLQKVTATVLKD